MMSRDTVPGRSASMCVVRKRTVGPFTLHLGGEEKGAELILMLNKRTKKQKKGIAWHGMACNGSLALLELVVTRRREEKNTVPT